MVGPFIPHIAQRGSGDREGGLFKNYLTDIRSPSVSGTNSSSASHVVVGRRVDIGERFQERLRMSAR